MNCLKFMALFAFVQSCIDFVFLLKTQQYANSLNSGSIYVFNIIKIVVVYQLCMQIVCIIIKSIEIVMLIWRI